MKRYTALAACLLLALMQGFAQDKTTTTVDKSATTIAPTADAKHKIMLVPFEPRMYLSEIDHLVNRDTKLSALAIKAAFRDGLDDQLYKKLKTQYQVVSLLDDTVKYKKDLSSIYQYLSYDYQKVPDQTRYTPPKKEKDVKGINKGQVTVETASGDARFMNAKIKNATLIPYLYGKYKTDLFLFINELEIKGAQTALDVNASNNRRIVVHYTVYTYDAKEVNSGIAEIEFPTTVNTPSKIAAQYFSQIAQIVTDRIGMGLKLLKQSPATTTKPTPTTSTTPKPATSKP